MSESLSEATSFAALAFVVGFLEWLGGFFAVALAFGGMLIMMMCCKRKYSNG
jgi:hypothetical protein